MGPGQLKPLPAIHATRQRAPARSALEVDCLPAFVVQDDALAPAFHRGDVLVPVTCREHPPSLGDYVLIAAEGGRHSVLRYITPLPRGRSGDTAHLAWEGGRYRRIAPAELLGRILAVRRGDRTYDLAASEPAAWRRRLLGLGHRLLARLRGWLPGGP